MSLPRPKSAPKKIPAWAIKWAQWVAATAPWRLKKKHKPNPPAPAPLEMYDDVNVSLIPVTAQAVAGYVDGRWPTYAQLAAKFPHAQHLVSIAVFAKDNADALDVEPGDATVAQAAGWVKRQKVRGLKHAIVYTSLSQAQTLVNALSSQGLSLGVDYLLWTAHYNGSPHLCSPACGYGFKETAHATQWTDRAEGRSLDESLCSAEFFSS